MMQCKYFIRCMCRWFRWSINDIYIGETMGTCWFN